MASAPTPDRQWSDASESFYVGRCLDATPVHVVSRSDVGPLPHLGYRCDAPFEWGSSSPPGALELAAAILGDAYREVPELVCDQFCAEVIAALPRAGFVLGSADLALWLRVELSESTRWRRSAG